jgi:hypothetical protein
VTNELPSLASIENRIKLASSRQCSLFGMTFTRVRSQFAVRKGVWRGRAVQNLTSRLLQTVTLKLGSIIKISVGAYESAYEKTLVGSIEVRELPAGRWITTKVVGRYFERADGLFMRLFDYIKANDISMTVPVQGGLTNAEMRFYLHEDAPSAPLRQNWLRSSTTLFAGLRAWVVGEHTPRLTCARPSNS